MFDGKRINFTVNAETAVACGAALEAAVIDHRKGEQKRVERVPADIGFKTLNGQMEVIIPRGTQLPVTISHFFSTTMDN